MSNQDGKTLLCTYGPGSGSRLRQMTVEGTENSWAKLEQAVLVYPKRNRHGLTMLIYWITEITMALINESQQ